jgi:1-acyl-sn-glycerol-3-phosphate acyltransferase
MEKIGQAIIFLGFTYPLGILIGIIFWLFRFLGIAKVRGWENFPKWQGRVVVVSNHPSLLDPIILIGLFFPQYLVRPFKYGPWNMAEKSNYGNLLFWLMRPRLILIKRGDRRSELKGLISAKNALNAGGVMFLFPEGGRTSSAKPGEVLLASAAGQKIRRFKPGCAWLAKETGALVLPLWVQGTDRVLPNSPKVSYFRVFRFWQRVVIKLGRPRRFEKSARLEAITETLEKAVLALADQEEGD